MENEQAKRMTVCKICRTLIELLRCRIFPWEKQREGAACFTFLQPRRLTDGPNNAISPKWASSSTSAHASPSPTRALLCIGKSRAMQTSKQRAATPQVFVMAHSRRPFKTAHSITQNFPLPRASLQNLPPWLPLNGSWLMGRQQLQKKQRRTVEERSPIQISWEFHWQAIWCWLDWPGVSFCHRI